jgi:uncharacterized membrane protein
VWTGREVAIVTVAVLVASLALQLVVYATGHPLGDIPGRYIVDGVRPGRLPYLDASVEYPVGIGVAMWIAALASTSAWTFFLATATMTAAGVALLVGMLYRRAPDRIGWFLLAPAFFLYVFHNWDVLALVPAIAGVFAYQRGQDGRAGALLALGAVIKVFPGLFLIPLAVARIASRRPGAGRMAAAAAAVAVAANLPFALLSPSGWTYPLRFQGARQATWGSLTAQVLALPGVRDVLERTPSTANTLSTLGLLAGIGLVAWAAWARRISAPALAAATVIVFLLTNKVYSPNYDLWLVAFFPLVAWRAAIRRSFGAVTVLVFVAVFGMFHGVVPRDVTATVMPWLVVARSTILVVALVQVLDAPARVRLRTPAPV